MFLFPELLNKNQENILNVLNKLESNVNEKMKKYDEKLNTIITLVHERNGILEDPQNNQFENTISGLSSATEENPQNYQMENTISDLPLLTEEDLNRFERNLSFVYNFKKQLVVPIYIH